MSSISEDRDNVVRVNNDLGENQGDAARDHTSSFAGENLTENPVKLPETFRGHTNEMRDYDDNRSTTEQIIEIFEAETVKLIRSKPA